MICLDVPIDETQVGFPLNDTNPYRSPQQDPATSSAEKPWQYWLWAWCVYGLFCNLWYIGAIALYAFVYGDTSATFGLYPIIPAALLAGFSVWCARHYTPLLLILAVVTSPLTILFTYNLLRFGF